MGANSNRGGVMGYDLSALVYVMIAVILMIKFYASVSGSGTCS